MAVRGADNVARAEDAIRKAETAGWIERGNYAPTKEQRFFGLGGIADVDGIERWCRHAEHNGLTPRRPDSAYHWITKTHIWLESDVVDTMLKRPPP